jgi:DNA polymerase V
MLGLVDGNNFYASCERVFDPRLRGRPVIVLSNNDGCAIARSQEAKALGIKMGQPIHEVPTDVRKQCIVRSANFGLYGDMSGRVVQVLRDLFPRVEVYSIDESFVLFEGVRDPIALATEARRRILQWIGIACCVGLGGTRTLAKAGNKMAKATTHGVIQVERSMLDTYPVEDVWGVGRKFTVRLGAEGILTAGDLARADPETLRARYGVVLSRTQMELNGQPCSDLEEVEPQRKELVVSRSFGREVTELEDLSQAAATFAIRACEKLRARSLKANGVWVWVNTNPFKPDAPQYHPSQAFNLIRPTSDTREVLFVVQGLLKAMHRPGYAYKKAGVGLLDLVDSNVVQGDLFSPQDEPRAGKNMDVMDSINKRFGRGTMGMASSGWKAKPTWGMRQENLSPAYTTRWSDVMRVR